MNESKEKDPRVVRKIQQMYDSTKRQGHEKRKGTVDANREERKKAKLARREEVLENDQEQFQLEGRVSRFSEQRVAKFRPLEGERNDGAV